MMSEEKVKGFPSVLVAKDVTEGLAAWYVEIFMCLLSIKMAGTLFELILISCLLV